MKGFIRRLLEKQIVLGSLSVKLSTVAVTAVSVLVSGWWDGRRSCDTGKYAKIQ